MFIIAILLLNYVRECSSLDNALCSVLLTQDFSTTFPIQDFSPATQGAIDLGCHFSVNSISFLVSLLYYHHVSNETKLYP